MASRITMPMITTAAAPPPNHHMVRRPRLSGGSGGASVVAGAAAPSRVIVPDLDQPGPRSINDSVPVPPLDPRDAAVPVAPRSGSPPRRAGGGLVVVVTDP